MRRTSTAAALAAGALVMTGWPTAAVADQTYTTQKYPVEAQNGAPAARGWVINTHMNGPVNYGKERYSLSGAAPSTTYAVRLDIFLDEPCKGPRAFAFPTATLTTNANGNGHAKATFTVKDVRPLVPVEMTVFGVWTFSTGSTVAYSTGCQAIDLDVPPPPPPGRAGR